MEFSVLAKNVAFDAGHLFVEVPLIVDVLLGQPEQMFGVLGIGTRNMANLAFLHGEIAEPQLRLVAIEMKRMFAGVGESRIVVIKRPEAALHGVFLMRH